MPERDGYIPGVPCWIDTSQPDPEAAVDFYSGLFGWEFEDVMPPESEGKYFIARIRGGDVAAVGSIPEGAPPMAMWNTYVWVESADETASKVLDAGGKALMEPFDVMDAGRMAVFADPEGAAFCVWQAKEHKGARIVNEARFPELQRPQHPRRGRREVLLRLGVRLADPGAAAAAPRCGRCPATATTWRSSTPASASRWPRSAVRRASRTSWRASTRSPTTSRTSRRTGT